MTDNKPLTLNKDVKALTFTIIFEGSALNRDEKIGGNIPSIKKLTRYANGQRGKTFSFISRESMRHHLFVTLSQNYPDRWQPAPTTAMNDVVQFDLSKANIITHAELDAFGYMFTQSKIAAITRKGTVGLLKAVALESWEGDMQFNANHDLAGRCGAFPDPVNKEEHLSYYKASFTIDFEKFGIDEWKIVSHEINTGKKMINLYMTEKGQELIIPNVVKDNEDGEQKEYIVNEERLIIDGNKLFVPKKLMKKPDKKNVLSFDNKALVKAQRDKSEKSEEKDKGKKQSFSIPEAEYEYNEDDERYSFIVTDSNYDPDRKELKISRVMSFAVDYHEGKDGCYKLTPEKENCLEIDSKKKIARFKLDPNEKNDRIKDITQTIKNGLYFHTSGENTGIVPKFIIGAALKLPIPLFHSYVDLNGFNNAILDNDYILRCDSNEKKMIFCQNHMNQDKFDVKAAEKDWNQFLEQIGLKEAKNEQPNSQG